MIFSLVFCSLFVVVTAFGSTCIRNEERIITADDAGSGDWLGFSVAFKSGIVVAGAPEHDGSGLIRTGAVYLFDVATGTQLAKIMADDVSHGQNLGSSVAVDNGIVLAGAMDDDQAGFTAGAAYLFDITTPSAPTQLHKLIASDAESHDEFGVAVAIDGNVAIVGDDIHGQQAQPSGAAYVFDVETGAELYILTPEDMPQLAWFGHSVGVSGNIAVIGAPRDGSLDHGSVYLFDVTSGEQLAKIIVDPLQDFEYLGQSVAIEGDIVVVGAPGDFDRAFLFDVSDPTNPVQLSSFEPINGSTYDGFGNAVAIDDELVIVGAESDGGHSEGAAYLFDISDPTQPRQIVKWTLDDIEASSHLGFSVAVEGAYGLACSRWYDEPVSKAGAVVVFDALYRCEADLDCDEIVGDNDLLSLLNNWGTAGGGDLNFDGTINVLDLLLLLAAWGPCM